MMEVDGVQQELADGVESTNSNAPDGGKFANLKAFVTAAREFEATHSETAVNLMTRYLGVSNRKSFITNNFCKPGTAVCFISSLLKGLMFSPLWYR